MQIIMTTKLNDSFAFTKKFLVKYRQMGAVVPSSKYLARAMVAALPSMTPGKYIIELGAGTGVFTRQLLADRPSNPTVAIELDHDLAVTLRSEYPKATVIEGDASKLSDILASLNIQQDQVGGILSAIPFISLPASIGDSIFSAIADVLTTGMPYIQVTYFSPSWRKFNVWKYFDRPSIKRVWRNVPPAEVMEFIRK
jgi:phospholipid N-methyltransferase